MPPLASDVNIEPMSFAVSVASAKVRWISFNSVVEVSPWSMAAMI